MFPDNGFEHSYSKQSEKMRLKKKRKNINPIVLAGVQSRHLQAQGQEVGDVPPWAATQVQNCPGRGLWGVNLFASLKYTQNKTFQVQQGHTLRAHIHVRLTLQTPPPPKSAFLPRFFGGLGGLSADCHPFVTVTTRAAKGYLF